MEKPSVSAKISLFLMRALGRLPLSWLYGLGSAAAWVIRVLLGYRKAVIYKNLTLSFPEKSAQEIQAIAKAYYDRIGELAAEAIWFGGCRGEKGRARLRQAHIYEITNSMELVRAQKERGVMVMKSHCGNWELFGGIFEYDYVQDLHDYLNKDNFYVVYRQMSNKASDHVFYENRRAPLPDYQGLLEHMRMRRHTVEHRGVRPIYVVNGDQKPYQGAHLVGTFLNQQTYGMLGGFSLACKLGFAVLYSREERISRGHYRMSFTVISQNALGQDPSELMRRYYALLEEDIRKDPVNWLWSHNRWKMPKHIVE